MQKQNHFEFLVQYTEEKKHEYKFMWFLYIQIPKVNYQYPKYLLLCISNAFCISLKGHIKIDLKTRLNWSPRLKHCLV